MGFYDAKGYWREYGEGFYDFNGDWVSPGGAYHDAKGYLRSPGDGFYDAKGNYVLPGEPFYDIKGERHSPILESEIRKSFAEYEFGIAYCFLLLLPFAILWLLTSFFIQKIEGHLFLSFGVYAFLDMVVCIAVIRLKKHRGLKSFFSFAGNYMCILSYAYIVLGYAVPYMEKNKRDFSSFLNFVLFSILGIGAVAILQFFNYYHEIAFVEFISGIAFFITVIVILKYASGDTNTLENLAEIYHVKPTMMFRLIFQIMK